MWAMKMINLMVSVKLNKIECPFTSFMRTLNC